MADADMKAMTADIETPVFATTSFTPPPPLDRSTVASATTPSLPLPDPDDFGSPDPGFRLPPGSPRTVSAAHRPPSCHPRAISCSSPSPGVTSGLPSATHRPGVTVLPAARK